MEESVRTGMANNCARDVGGRMTPNIERLYELSVIEELILDAMFAEKPITASGILRQIIERKSYLLNDVPKETPVRSGPQFEYGVFCLYNNPKYDADELSAKGREGWELICVRDYDEIPHAIMKRVMLEA